MSYIIALSGSHGTGKTTDTFRQATIQKTLHPSKTIAVIPEQASLSLYPINKQGTRSGQLWIFTRQIEQELEYLGKFDIVISDRTAVDSIAYTYVAGFYELAGSMLSLVQNHTKVYRKIIFKRIVDNNFCYEDGARESSDAVFRQAVEDQMLLLYRIIFKDYLSSIMEFR
ncbi:MAG: hypothetical protein KAI40_03290 [Desulfobacterales bacterium]|nr:hypothetical protein [Desulfobacterales bacterium]